MEPTPFTVPYSEEAVADLRLRLGSTRWPDSIPGTGWEYGAGLEYMKEICRYWEDEFDWKKQVQEISKFSHFRCTVQDVGIHFILEKGKGGNAIPLILTHGWPGSFLEMLKIIPLLTDPAKHGGDPSVCFDVIVPSLPGFGFSDRPSQRGMNTFKIAELWIELMQALGYKRFAAQGGDFGAAVSTILGLRYPDRILAIHLNYIPGSYRPDLQASAKLTEVEEASLRDTDQWYADYGGYAHVQRTTPQTLAYGLNDSPMGLAAWIIEKFRDWADCGGDVEKRFSKDELLTNVTLYWMTETIHSSCRLYFEGRKAPLQFRPGDFVNVPCGIAYFPKEDPFPQRQWIERGYNVQRWTEMPRGGHFGAAEEPELLAQDIGEFFGGLKPGR